MHRCVFSSVQCLRLGIQNSSRTYSGSGVLNNTFSKEFFRAKSSTSNINEERTVITDDGSVVVCWHPEKPFPYEYSKPIPVEVREENSVLKIQNVSQIYEIFKPKKEEFVREELMKITYTTKHVWFRKNGQKYKKSMPPPDREYL